MKYFLWKDLVLYRCYTKAVFYIPCCFVLKGKKLKMGDGPLFK